MTEKNIKKLLNKLGVPADKQAVIIEKSNKDDEEWDETDVLDAAKKWAIPLVKDEIEKEARQAGASGAISKVLKAMYDADTDDTKGTFEEWKVVHKDKDYAKLIGEKIAAAKNKGASTDEAVKELTKKLSDAMEANKTSAKSLEDKEAEWSKKWEARDLRELLDKEILAHDKKPINNKINQIFFADLEEKGIEIRLHEGKPTPFKKGETAPLQNATKTGLVPFSDLYTEFTKENEAFYVQSAGPKKDESDDKTDGKTIKDLGNGFKQTVGRRPIPAD